MTTPLNVRTERGLQLAIDIGERIFIVLLFATLTARICQTIVARPFNIVVLLSEGMVAFFVIVRRPAFSITMRPLDWAIALFCTALAMVVRPGGTPVLPAIVGAGLMLAGLFLSIWAKLSLRRSFGLAAANRGAVIVGPYRFVRHPMYTGYMTLYVGFLLNNPLAWNLAVYGTTALLLVVRVLAEERILKTDPVYDAYSGKVRFRLIPALF